MERAGVNADRMLFICTQKITEKDEINEKDLYLVGTVAKIKQVAQLNGGVLRVVCEGLYRAKAREIKEENGCYIAVCDEIIPRRGDDEVLEEAYFRTAKALVKDVLGTEGKLAKETVSSPAVTAVALETVAPVTA